MTAIVMSELVQATEEVQPTKETASETTE
jgi:hypothetical protein